MRDAGLFIFRTTAAFNTARVVRLTHLCCSSSTCSFSALHRTEAYRVRADPDLQQLTDPHKMLKRFRTIQHELTKLEEKDGHKWRNHLHFLCQTGDVRVGTQNTSSQSSKSIATSLSFPSPSGTKRRFRPTASLCRIPNSSSRRLRTSLQGEHHRAQ